MISYQTWLVTTIMICCVSFWIGVIWSVRKMDEEENRLIREKNNERLNKKHEILSEMNQDLTHTTDAEDNPCLHEFRVIAIAGMHNIEECTKCHKQASNYNVINH